ncbi:hypothetical protein [Saccharospirillum mangrovi]
MKSKRDVWCASIAALVAVLVPQVLNIPGYVIGLRESAEGYDPAYRIR